MSSTTTQIIEPGSPEFKERIGQINGRLRKTTADQIETGLLLLELHQRLPHGCKARIYRDSDDPLPGIEPLDITQADGEQLIRIAKNDALSKSRNSEKLPWALSTLEVLSKVPAETLQAAIDRGDLNPKLKCPEAKQLVRKLKGEPATAKKTDQPWNAVVEEKLFDNLLTPAGVDFLSTAKVELEALARKEAAQKGPSLTKTEITDYVNKLIGLTFGSVKAVDVIAAIERVIEGRICGSFQRTLLDRVIEAQSAATTTPKADSARKVAAR